MDENKCCENYASSYAKDMDSFCVREFLHDLAVCDKASDHHVRIINGWTEITPDNVDEIKSIESNRVIICASNGIGYMYPLTLLSLECSLESIADYGGHYYFVLPELKIE